MILFAASTKDVASINITEQILKNYPFKPANEKFQGMPVYAAEIGGKEAKLVILDNELIYAQNITDFSPHLELIIFVSRHSSVSGTPTLSVHTPGNLGESADLGGKPKSVSISPANAMRTALKAMAKLVEEKQLNNDYKVCYECTHHGPSLDKPAMFVELGSSQKQWEDKRAAEVVAHAAMEAALNFGKKEAKAVLGIGGPHYNEKFTRTALETDIAFGHMIPKYGIPAVSEEILRQCVEKTFEIVDSAVLDWKGIKGEDKPKLVEMLDAIGVQTQKI